MRSWGFLLPLQLAKIRKEASLSISRLCFYLSSSTDSKEKALVYTPQGIESAKFVASHEKCFQFYVYLNLFNQVKILTSPHAWQVKDSNNRYSLFVGRWSFSIGRRRMKFSNCTDMCLALTSFYPLPVSPRYLTRCMAYVAYSNMIRTLYVGLENNDILKSVNSNPNYVLSSFGPCFVMGVCVWALEPVKIFQYPLASH